MAEKFKFRYVNEIVGSFVLLIVALLLAGIFLAGHAQQWFVPVHRFTLAFPPEGSFGLKNGAEVIILGTTVGKIDRITVNEDGLMSGRISIKGDFIRFIRDDSKALVKNKFVVAGDTYVEITKGKGPQLPPGSTLEAVKDTEITEMIQGVLEEIKEVTLPTIEQGRMALEEYTKLAADLRDPEGNLQQLIARLARIAGGLEKGEGMAGALMKDPTLADELQSIITRVSNSFDQLAEILDNVTEATKKLPKMTDAVSGELEDASGFVLQTRDTLRETQRLIEAIQRHWLIRSYVRKGEPSELIPATEVSSGREEQ